MKLFTRNKQKKATASLTNTLSVVAVLAMLGAVYALGATISTIATHKSITNAVRATSYSVEKQKDFISALEVKGGTSEKADLSRVSYPQIAVTAKVEKPSVVTVLSKYVPEFLLALAAFVVSLLLIRVVKRVEDGESFSEATLADLRKITLIVGLGSGAVTFVPPLQAIVIGSEDGFVQAKHFSGSMNSAWVVAGLVVISLGELAVRVGRDAITLKEEIDGTI